MIYFFDYVVSFPSVMTPELSPSSDLTALGCETPPNAGAFWLDVFHSRLSRDLGSYPSVAGEIHPAA
ncbi:hypothetical protein GOD78_32265 [Sinorhizobium medicae]|uniref:hypothetical protein n=1 Tax=Sinorhizobium medicae TaxID=110321 RepID=UPI000FD8BF8B|nr:hypothetical protein [Sinorhizobium medicae]MDX0605745.1 hypothetical protein [Sinorhizobium medicae]MDX0821975.1 hypothetical protein [Sinorhizobium medicae]MDX0865028.1 hypothetical protein [Sinorhizobium medicae]RVJ16610.1 hypothetical protein CN179_32625 [Sinorhizobium medicae]UFX06645.1 hypothetical protein SmedWSM1115_33750 [Sinorhizobium medicae WSM1115]